MKKLAVWMVALASACGIAAPALAQNVETWASPVGTDANSCASQAAACRTINRALDQLLNGGTVHVLPGTYERFSVQKSARIVAESGPATIRNLEFANGIGGGSIRIVASSQSVVSIRGLSVGRSPDASTPVPPPGTPLAGIFIAAAKAVHLEDVQVVDAIPGAVGVLLGVTSEVAGSPPVQLVIRRSTILANAGGGVLVRPINGIAASVVLEDVSMSTGLFGVKADNSGGSGKITVDVVNSLASGNSNNGVLAVGTGANPVHVMVDRSTLENNGAFGAVATGAQAFMIVSGSTLMRNGTGLAQQNGATVATAGNNVINFNTANISGTITPLALK